MGWSTPKTWAYKETLSSSDMNTYIRDNLNALRDGTGLANAIITPSKLATGAAGAFVATSETTASITYADLTTITDTVTVIIGANGLVLISLYGSLGHNVANNKVYISFAASGANIIAASDIYAIMFQAYGNVTSGNYGVTHLLTGLSAGSTVFKMKYRTTDATATFFDRRIAVVPL